ncbi:MAG TPA: hypothetical protein VMR34_05280 [Candidatus Saccharimonadales bacterium]|nr:hypothetical protein [Candidatus Saccharimonadales bacterium]
MKTYRSKYGQLPGTSHANVIRAARYEYHKIQKRTPRRQAYVRSKYFKNDKIFVNQFWEHLKQKHAGDQLRRAKLFVCAIDLIRHNTLDPDTIYTYTNMNVSLHRFYGQTKDGFMFCVQIRENKQSGRKDFMSAFPMSKSK